MKKHADFTSGEVVEIVTEAVRKALSDAIIKRARETAAAKKPRRKARK